MRPVHCLVAPLISIASILVVAAEGQAGETRPWSVRVWQSDGLPDRHINGLAQTDDGFLWLATSEHVARFDGTRFEAFPTRPIVPRGIRAFLKGRDSLWLATNRGPLVRLRPGTAPDLVAGLPEMSADALVEDDEGAVWIAYHDGGVSRVHGGRVTTFDETSGLARTGSCWLARDGRGRIWYAQGAQVGLFENGGFRPLVRMPTPTTRLASARAGGVWIGSGPNLFRYDAGGVLEPMGSLPAANQGTRMSVLLEGRDGALWIGTRHDGLFRRSDTGVETVPSSHSAIRCLMEDREGNLWVGTGGGGLNRVQPRVLEVEGASTGLPSKLLQSVAQDADGVMWGTTRNGLLVRRANGGWETVAPEGLGSASAVAADSAGALWIGTRSIRLHRLSKGRLTTWTRTEGLDAHSICSVLPSRSGDVWIIGETAGARNVLRPSVQRLRAGKLENIVVPGGTRRTLAAAEDAHGDVWIGGIRGALLRAQGTSLVEETAASSVVRKQIRALHATGDGSLWIGYDEGGGLGRWKDGRFTHIGHAQGLPGDTVAQIIEDAAGSLWLGTDGGLAKLGRRDLEAVLDGRAPHVRPIDVRADEASFNVSAGECGWTAAVLSRQGTIWMPMGTALLIAHPDRLVEDAGSPPVLLTRVTVDGQVRASYRDIMPVAPEEQGALDLRRAAALSMRPGDRRLEIEFTAPAFRAPENVRFRYRLDGFDETWVDARAERLARYSRLPPGTYRFRVSSCTRDGTCDETGAGLDVAVAPLFWQTWWFRLCAMAAFTLALAAAVRYASFRRLRRSLAVLEQQAVLDRERTRIARDIHDDVGNRLNRITLLGELALRGGSEPGAMTRHVRDISAGVREVITALDEVVWTVSPRHDTLPHLVSRLGQFAVEYLRAATVRCELDLPAQPPEWPVSAEVRHHVFCAVKEALTNSVRHGQPREVKLQVAVGTDSFTIVVQDDGRGFDGSASDPGADGLRNMEQRMAEVGGRMEVTSTPGTGTRVCLSVPRPHRSPARESRV
jgi:signal transduction histidine kinase/ligand-binding sensor domain-containing protein